MKKSSSLDEVLNMIRESKSKREAVSIGYLGNVVDLW